jgi:hypothetical protein
MNGDKKFDEETPKGDTGHFYSDSSDEDYEEECKGNWNLTLDVVPSPQKITPLVGISRKEYLEDETIERYKKTDSEDKEGDSEDMGEDKRYPILYVDVNLGEERVERLTVLEGDYANDVAHEF